MFTSYNQSVKANCDKHAPVPYNRATTFMTQEQKFSDKFLHTNDLQTMPYLGYNSGFLYSNSISVVQIANENMSKIITKLNEEIKRLGEENFNKQNELIIKQTKLELLHEDSFNAYSREIPIEDVKNVNELKLRKIVHGINQMTRNQLEHYYNMIKDRQELNLPDFTDVTTTDESGSKYNSKPYFGSILLSAIFQSNEFDIIEEINGKEVIRYDKALNALFLENGSQPMTADEITKTTDFMNIQAELEATKTALEYEQEMFSDENMRKDYELAKRDPDNPFEGTFEEYVEQLSYLTPKKERLENIEGQIAGLYPKEEQPEEQKETGGSSHQHYMLGVMERQLERIAEKGFKQGYMKARGTGQKAAETIKSLQFMSPAARKVFEQSRARVLPNIPKPKPEPEPEPVSVPVAEFQPTQMVLRSGYDPLRGALGGGGY